MNATSKKISTNELPMVGLEEAVKLVTKIHEKALETAPMPKVAKGCDYASATSTPFYRRLAAARLFRLLSAPKPELTKTALNYLKPDTESGKQSALIQAVMGIKTYAETVDQYASKRLNVELITNKFEKDDALSLSKACAKICAESLVASLKFAGFISADGTVMIPASGCAPEEPPPPQIHVDQSTKNGVLEHGDGGKANANGGETQVQTLYLDNKRKRKFTIDAPLTITSEELERIRAWLGFQLIIEEAEAPEAHRKDLAVEGINRIEKQPETS